MTRFVQCGPDLSVNREEVASVSWGRSPYDYGSRDAKLIITLKNGVQHTVFHKPNYLDGIDCYKIKRELIADD